MFKIGIAGIIITVALSYLRHDFVKQWIRKTLHLKSNWWIDTVSFAIISVSGTVALYILVLTQNARELAEESKNNLQSQVESLSPYRQPITGGHAILQIRVKSNLQVQAHVSGQGALVHFMKGSISLLWGGSMVYDQIQSGEGFIYYSSEFVLYVDSAGRGLPVFALRDTESIKLIFHGMPDNSEILGGGLWCTVNSSISLTFPIPHQIAQGKEISIPNIHKVLQALTP